MTRRVMICLTFVAVGFAALCWSIGQANAASATLTKNSVRHADNAAQSGSHHSMGGKGARIF
jgi:hypothetical protein